MTNVEKAKIEIENAFYKTADIFCEKVREQIVIYREIQEKERMKRQRERKNREKRLGEKILDAAEKGITIEQKKISTIITKTNEDKIVTNPKNPLETAIILSNRLSYVDDMNDIKETIQKYANFIKNNLRSDDVELYSAADYVYPKVMECLSLLHIHIAHPQAAIKRAKELWEPKKPRPVYSEW
jgi:hypothetical protein